MENLIVSQSGVVSKPVLTEDERAKARSNTTYTAVLSNTRGMFGFLSLILGLILWTKIDTTLEPKLRNDFGYNPSIVALFYTIQFIGYLLLSPYAHKILEHYDGTLLTVLSFYAIGLASFLVGPSWLFDSFLPNSIALIIPGLFITGMATVFTTIGTY